MRASPRAFFAKPSVGIQLLVGKLGFVWLSVDSVVHSFDDVFGNKIRFCSVHCNSVNSGTAGMYFRLSNQNVDKTEKKQNGYHFGQ